MKSRTSCEESFTEKTYRFFCGAKYKELLETRRFNSLITALAQKDGNETHAPVSSQDRPQDMVMVPRKKDGKYKIFCHFFNNWHFCKHGESCKYRHEDSPVCKQVIKSLLALIPTTANRRQHQKNQG